MILRGEQRIEPVLRQYGAFFRDHYQGKFQLVVVLNGCRDNTLGVVQRVAKGFPSISALEFKEPIGKGGALIAVPAHGGLGGGTSAMGEGAGDGAADSAGNLADAVNMEAIQLEQKGMIADMDLVSLKLKQTFKAK